MTNSKQALWQQYYAAVKAGKKIEADTILRRLHNSNPNARRSSGGGCSRCKKRLGG